MTTATNDAITNAMTKALTIEYTPKIEITEAPKEQGVIIRKGLGHGLRIKDMENLSIIKAREGRSIDDRLN